MIAGDQAVFLAAVVMSLALAVNALRSRRLTLKRIIVMLVIWGAIFAAVAIAARLARLT